jgi:hypothetical protein
LQDDTKDSIIRWVGFSGMLLSFVTTLQDDTKDSIIRWVGFSGMLLSFVTTLCSPNEDFGSLNQHFRMLFRSNFQRFLAQI